MADVNFKSVAKRFGALTVIPNLDLTIHDGSFTVLVGPSGCGKSTLLRMIAGLEEVSSGAIFIGGENVTHRDPSERGIAMVFQSYALYPHMTVADNIGFGLKLAGMGKAELETRVSEAASILQLTTLLDRKPRQLSGGQRQRVAIGRAIVRKPKVFLFDEPLSNLDASLRSQMRVELSELHERLKATMVYVTHDQVEAMTMADQIAVLKGGKIEQVGAPMDLYSKPATPFVAGFIGSPRMNFIEGPEALALGAELIGIRPEHLKIGAEGRWRGRIRHIEHLGSETIAYVDTADIGSLTIKVEGDFDVSLGSAIAIWFDESNLHRFSGGFRGAQS